MIQHYSLIINGELKDTKMKQEIINPCTGEAIATVSVADKQEVELTISSARQAFDSGLWKNISFTERKISCLKFPKRF